MSATRHKFIGGFADGKVLTVKNMSPVFQVSQPLDLKIECSSLLDYSLEVHLYNRHEFRCGNDTWFIYVHNKLTIEKAFELLINNYRPTQ